MQTVIPAAPVTVRWNFSPRITLRAPGIGATAKAIVHAMGTALTMTYVAPYGAARKAAPDASGLNGRDPNW
jgi:hypothetical protein